jgi:hypothetical protein
VNRDLCEKPDEPGGADDQNGVGDKSSGKVVRENTTRCSLNGNG